MLFNFNRIFNYIKTQYARDNAIILIIIRNLQFLNFSLYWNYIENHDIEIAIATYWILFNFKENLLSSWNYSNFKNHKLFFKKKNDFRAFMMRFWKNFILENNDLLKSILLQDVFETLIQQTQSTLLIY